jgi:hypothetical protein
VRAVNGRDGVASIRPLDDLEDKNNDQKYRDTHQNTNALTHSEVTYKRLQFTAKTQFTGNNSVFRWKLVIGTGVNVTREIRPWSVAHTRGLSHRNWLLWSNVR